MKQIVLEIDKISDIGLYPTAILAYLKAHKNKPELITDEGYRSIKVSQICTDLGINDDLDLYHHIEYLTDYELIKNYRYSENWGILFYKIYPLNN